MSMAYTNAALAFNSTSGLSYTYNNQLTGDNLISSTLTANSTGITLDHSGQNITISDLGIIMTSASIKALSAGLYPLLLADSSGNSVAFITDAGYLSCQGIRSSLQVYAATLSVAHDKSTIDSSGNIIGASITANKWC